MSPPPQSESWKKLAASAAMDGSREKAPGSSVRPPAPAHFSSAAAGSSSTSRPTNQWMMYTQPPDTLLSFIHSPQTPPFRPMNHPSNFNPPQQGQPSMENFHFVGFPPQLGSFSTPPPPPQHAKGIPSSSRSASAKVAPSSKCSSKKKKLVVNLEEDQEPARTAQRLPWTSEEETRLASAWLENSYDPIDGNNKKSERYWDDVAADYNSNTPSHRKRDAIQLKQHFHKVKTKINAFHGEYSNVTKVYTSGFSDDQLQAMALEKYEKNRGTSFTHLLMWRRLKDDGKWLALMAAMKEEQNKKPSAGINLASHVINVDDEQRPSAGRNKAKAERDGKRKAPEAVMVIGEKLDKLIEVQAASKKERQKVIESQQRLSSEKLQTAKLAKETKMLDLYEKLLLGDTSVMDDVAKAARARAMASMESNLFRQGNEGRFSIIRRPARLHNRSCLHDIMLACIILHNMIVVDEGENAADILDLNESASTSTILPPVFSHGVPEFADVLRRDSDIRDRSTHKALKNDLIEHIWAKFGPK